ncbi:MAG: hypothetical protein HGA66_09625 [Holophaga sp.]|nr:hypothetical protein [Holophaga sp.]
MALPTASTTPFDPELGFQAPPEPVRPGLEEARSCPPGSEWLDVRIHVGPADSDAILSGLLATLRTITVQAWDRWFFERGADPEPHLRLRFHGVPSLLGGNLLPLIRRILAPHLKSGACWKLQVDTYEREIERYGGLEGMLLAEAWFEQDSERVLDLLRVSGSDARAGLRWQHAFRGIDSLLSHLGLSLAAKLRVVDAMRDGLCPDVDDGPHLQLGDRYQALRRDLEAWIPGPGQRFPAILPDPRLHRQRTCLNRLAGASLEGRLSQPLEELASGLAHLLVNRYIRSSHTAHERVLSDFLGRVYRSQLARVGLSRDKMEG